MTNAIITAQGITMNGVTYQAEYSKTPKGTVVAFVQLDDMAVRLKFEQSHAQYTEALAAWEARYTGGSAPAQEITKAAFAGMTVAFTGVLPGMMRAEAMALVKAHGGKSFDSVMSATNLLIIGDKPGRNKLEKAMARGIRTMAAADFLAMIGVENPERAQEPTQAQAPEQVQESAQAQEPEQTQALANAEPSEKVEKVWVGTSIKGKGWEIFFDGGYDRTRVIFKRKPSPKVIETVKAAGFFWSPAMKSWNKKLTYKAFRAA